MSTETESLGLFFSSVRTRPTRIVGKDESRSQLSSRVYLPAFSIAAGGDGASWPLVGRVAGRQQLRLPR